MNTIPTTMWMTSVASPIGELQAFATDVGLRAIALPGSRAPARAERAGENDVLARVRRQLIEYFDGTRRDFDVPLDLIGTPFQRLAWQALRAIPFGETRTYREQAVAIGRPGAARAVGAANARNPVPVIVPCHRVIGADGSLTGFAGGLARKRALLEHEARGRSRGRNPGPRQPGSDARLDALRLT